MPRYARRYKKRYNRRRRYPRYNTWGAAKYLAKKAYAGVRYLKGLVNTEKHYFDTGATSTIDATTAIVLLTGMGQGDDVNNRNGNSILAKSLYFQGYVRRDPDNTVAINGVRIIIFMDLQNQGSAPTTTDVLSAGTVVAPLNVDHTSRYRILMDKRAVLVKDQPSDSFMFKRFFKMSDHLKYTGAQTTDVYTNAIYLLLVGDIGAASDPPVIQWTSRLGYHDN